MNFSIVQLFAVRNIQYFILGMGIFLFVYPSFLWQYTNFVTPIAALLLLLALFFEAVRKSSLQVTSFIPLLLFLLYTIYSGIIGVSLSTNLFATPVLVTLLFFVFSKDTIFSSYISFLQIFACFLALSLVFYLLKLTRLYSPELVLTTSPDGREYYTFPFNSMSAITLRNGLYLATGFYRFHGFMGEPGWIGTISGLVLFSLKFQFSKFKILYFYLLAALLSMSLGAYIPLFIGLIYFYFGKRLIYVIIPLTIFFVFNFDVLDRFIFERIVVQDGDVAGDNRTTPIFDQEWEKFLNTASVIWGKGQGQHTIFGNGISSWKTLVYNGGLIGFFLYILVFVSVYLVLVKNGNKRFAVVFFLVFLMTIYHRPRIQYVYFLIILYGGLLYNELEFRYLKMLNK